MQDESTLYQKNITYIVGKQYLDHEKDIFTDDIDVWVKAKTKSMNFGKWESECETRNAMRCNNRDDLLHLSFTLKISIFSEAYI